MKKIMIGTIEKTDENLRWFNIREGYEMTGETLTFEAENGAAATYVVFQGNRTWADTVRDCGDHYIKACYSEYISIDKKTLAITRDVEDR